jgi:maleylacetoacetate isomerase
VRFIGGLGGEVQFGDKFSRFLLKMPNLQLYSYWRSSASWRIRIILNLKQIKYDIVPVNLLKGEQNETYKKINPHGVIPSLKFPDGHILTQSASIAEFLDEVYAQEPLIHGDKWNKAKVLIN